MTDISVLIPVFNAANCLQETVQGIIGVLETSGKSYELILIDDGSKDNSWEVVKQVKNSNKNITGIKLNKNYGQHNALLCGLNNCSGNYIVTIDDDAEQNPDDILKLYKEITENDHDLVYGMPVNQRKNIFREILTYLYKLSSRIENKNAGNGSSFRLFKKSLKENLINHTGSLFFVDEIALWYTDKIGYVKVNYLRSKKSVSGYNPSSLFTMSLGVLSLSSTMPLRLVRFVGFYISGLSVLLALYFFTRKFFFNVPMGYTSLMVAILFGTGIITASLGIIGEYLGNLIALSNNKPSYSIKDKV
ncbi:MAG TPA: glycosyltransferase [Bacteroidia bacterium]|nr:glycosyltransferase [Bacteroidia bacterium]